MVVTSALLTHSRPSFPERGLAVPAPSPAPCSLSLSNARGEKITNWVLEGSTTQRYLEDELACELNGPVCILYIVMV